MNTIQVPIEDIVLDPRLQMRVSMDFDVIDEYAKNVADLPPCRVFMVDGRMLLTSGWHRFHAHRQSDRKTLSCIVVQGTFDDAVVDAAGQNHSHGIRRTNEDKRRAVAAMLEIFPDRTDNSIAKACHVSNHLVADIRAESKVGEFQLIKKSGEPVVFPERITGKDGKSHPASKPKNSNLCERCQRVGNTKDCQACAELKSNGKPKSDSRVQKPQPKQHAGLPKSVQNALADTWHADCAHTLSKMRQQCKGAFSWSTWLDAGVLDALKRAEEFFTTAIPRKACNECKGMTKIDGKMCQRCKGGGYLASQA